MLIRGIGLLGEKAPGSGVPTGMAIMQIVNIVNLDIVNVALGIVELVFCSDAEVRAYLEKADE